jgi:2-dehydro-3-deoxyphosphooctonate aldolase (KDO 8-P synthase)
MCGCYRLAWRLQFSMGLGKRVCDSAGKIVNVKKAQFLSGADMFYPAQKVLEAGNNQIILTERGNMYGYNNLAVDFRNVYDMKAFGYPVCMDCTHSVQRPGGAGGKTGGDRTFVPYMIALAAKGVWR